MILDQAVQAALTLKQLRRLVEDVRDQAFRSRGNSNWAGGTYGLKDPNSFKKLEVRIKAEANVQIEVIKRELGLIEAEEGEPLSRPPLHEILSRLEKIQEFLQQAGAQV
jgi:hypothetical protein